MKTKTKTKKKSKTITLSLIFDDEANVRQFINWWLDGGGEGDGKSYWYTDVRESDDWMEATPKKLRIKGFGSRCSKYGCSKYV